MRVLRLLADDLTGALDTAAEFTGSGPVPVRWSWAGAIPARLQGSAALDSGTREGARDAAVQAAARLAPALAGADLAYKKVDSLLRGHGWAELAACLRLGAWERCVVAPAFPHQGRITRRGRQLARGTDGAWSEAGDILAGLLAEGVSARAARPGEAPGPGVTVFDAESEADLARIAEAGRSSSGPVLWCGSGGLARALAGDLAPNASTALDAPVLGLFGSDQEATRRQLASCGPRWLRLDEGEPGGATLVQAYLNSEGIALVSFRLPPGLARAEAASRIAAEMDRLTRHLASPRTLIVAGGETLRALCGDLGAEALVVHGQVEPGLPRSRLRGGRWDGVEVISKSGAFGAEGLWRDLLARNGLLETEVGA